MSGAFPPPLRPARVHEVCGLGALAFAFGHVARQEAGPVVWLPAAPGRIPYPAGLVRWLAPERVLLVRAPREADRLWAAEEALRAGLGGLVVAELTRPLSLTAGRRLQLAAEAGAARGLLLIRPDQGSPAAETRWQAEPVPGPEGSTELHCRLIKNKSGTIGSWVVDLGQAAPPFPLVPPPGERGGIARAGP